MSENEKVSLNKIVMPPIIGFTVYIVAAAQKKGADEGAALVHVPAQEKLPEGWYGDADAPRENEPEGWYVGRFRDGRWIESWQFGSDLQGMQSACTKFVAVASEYVREYPSWAQKPRMVS